MGSPAVAAPCLESTGGCSSADQAALADASVVGDKQDACGKKALSLKGINHDKYVNCVEDFDTCSLDGLQEVLMLAASVEDLKEKKVLDFFTDLSVALGKIEPTVGDCKVVGSEVKKLLGALKAASPAHLAANVKTHHTEIFEAVAAW